MTDTTSAIGRFERLLTVELTDAEIDSAKAGAARRLAKDLKIPGFRPGKAPRPVVEAAIGTGRLRTEAIEDLIPKKLGELLEQSDLAPAIAPTLEKIDDIEGGVNAEVRITLWPELDDPPNFKDRSIEVESPDLSESDVDDSLDRMRRQFASLETVERSAAEGDFVSIDLSASSDGVTIEEAAATELLYEVGSGLLIEGIDEHLVGTSAGDEVDFQGPLPGGFGERTGQQVEFHVKINEVKARVLPDLDDDWVSEVSEFETVEELRTDLAARLTETKRRAVLSGFRQKALDLLVDEAGVDLPERLIGVEMDELLHRFVHRLEESDITLSDYFEASGISQDAFLEDLRSQADRSLRTRLVLEAVAKAEGIDVNSEEVARTIEAIARTSEKPKEVYDAFAQGSRALSLAGDILRSKALEAVIASARPVDSQGKPVDLTIEEPPDDAQEADELVAEVIEPDTYQAEAIAPGTYQPKVFEAEIVDEES